MISDRYSCCALPVTGPVLSSPVDVVVVGGGFFGATLAAHFGRRGFTTTLVEASDTLLGRASLNNQARVHAGFHYPRSFVTARRSWVNAPRFLADYRDCIYDDFQHHYAIARRFSNVSGQQFRRFCDRIGARWAPAAPEVQRWFSSALIEAVLTVPEYTFDAVRLRERVTTDLDAAGVSVALKTRAVRLTSNASTRSPLRLQLQHESAEWIDARFVFNCTYASLNELNAASGLPLIPLRRELAEMVLVDAPPLLRRAGVTVMCGPFFSLLPFPSRGLHSLSHVRYTPHGSWTDGDGSDLVSDAPEHLRCAPPDSHLPHIVRDAARYLPAIADCVPRDVLWEVKAVLPRSDTNDSRPILFGVNHGLPGYHCVLGAKLDNVYDMVQQVDSDPQLQLLTESETS